MTSTKILEDKLEEIEAAMGKIKFDINKLSEEVDQKLLLQDKKTKILNVLDEDTVEIRESIALIKAHLGGI